MELHVGIRGITPLIMNRFTEKSEVAVTSGMSTSLHGDRGTPREQAAPKRYADEQGFLYVPGPNIFACMIAAGVFHKSGRSKLTTQRTSLIPAGLMVEEMVCPIIDDHGRPIRDWEVDSRSVVIPATGGRVMCHRPRVDVWTTMFTIDVDESVFSPALVRAIVDDAGKKVGLGDFRPARKGPFGRFVVSHWEIRSEAEPAKVA